MAIQIGGLTLYTVEDLAEALNIQERTIRKFLREGTLKGRKLANRWFVSEESLREYFQQVDSPEEPGQASK
jgi:excisionase family DNA binding protein